MPIQHTRSRLMPPARTARLALALFCLAVWATPASREEPAVHWIERGLRPGLYNRGIPVSNAFRQYLDTHFTSDPRMIPPPPSYPIVTRPNARSVILLIGDGMGLAHVSSAGLAAYGAGGQLAIQRMPIVGLVRTWSATSLFTDSAAAATALATGSKTYNGAVGVDPMGKPLQSFFHTAKRYGKRTGLIVTCSLTHATPAAFVATVAMRTLEGDIAPQLIARDTNVLLGGGLSFFLPMSHPSGLSWRRDDRDVLREAVERGYQLTFDARKLAALNGERVLGLFGLNALPPAYAASPALCDMTDKALELLSKHDKGFCLMIEGSQIDWQSHMSNYEGMLWETLEFERAVARCLEFAEKDGETLVLVTADHETGGLGVAYRDNAGVSAYWIGAQHTGVDVPLYAYGPGCLQFAGTYDNTDVAVKIARILGLHDFPAADVGAPLPKQPLESRPPPVEDEGIGPGRD